MHGRWEQDRVDEDRTDAAALLLRRIRELNRAYQWTASCAVLLAIRDHLLADDDEG